MDYKIWKRALDLIGALAGLIVFVPIFPLAAFLIKRESPGPAIIRLNRVSKGKRIRVYKFRSMVQNAHEIRVELVGFNQRKDGPFFKIKNDPRITKTGKWLRRLHWDEIPQLINVLKGELSLVGPRPHEPEEVIHYPKEHQHLLLVKAGITGLSQVSGASNLPFLKELELDSYYVKHQSLQLDFKIIAKTLKILLFKPEGV